MEGFKEGKKHRKYQERNKTHEEGMKDEHKAERKNTGIEGLNEGKTEVITKEGKEEGTRIIKRKNITERGHEERKERKRNISKY